MPWLARKVNALGDLTTRRRAAEGHAGELQRQLDAARLARHTLAQSVREKTEERETCASQARRIETLTPQIQALETQARQHEDLRRCRRQMSEAQTRLEALTVARVEAETMHRAAAARLAELQSAQREGRAALLAQSLAENEPCPVCGSLHHPQPARAEIAPPSDADLATAEDRAAQADVALYRARNVEAQETASTSVLRSRADDLAGSLGEAVNIAPEEIVAALGDLRAEIGAATGAGERLSEIERALRELREHQTALEEASPGLEAAERNASVESQRIAAELAIHERDVPVGLRSPDALAARIAGDEETSHTLLSNLEAARTRVANAERDAASAQAAFDGRTAAWAAAEEAARGADDELVARLAEAGFPDAAALHAARRAPLEITRLEADCRDGDERHAAARERLARAEGAVNGWTLPDVAALAARHAAAAEALQHAAREQGALQERQRGLAAARTHLGEVETGLAAADRDYRVFGALSAAASGNNDRNLTLQRYVLGSLLDDVLVAATRRLLVMSQGRYQLERQREVIDGRAASGLALQVLDEYSGRRRPVGTLSGGESFLAALSLALGLTDVVQAHTGGVRMEAIFIDEGFGSLDPEALDCAFQALLDLQKGGRLIGIISHVEELKSRIDLRLEVQATRRGSATRLVGLP